MATALFMTSCSNEDSLSGSHVRDMNSDVPITLDLNHVSTATRAELGNRVNDVPDGTFDTDGGKIGMFCLATSKIFGEEEISWERDHDNPNFRWFENVQADAKTTGTVEANDRKTHLQWFNNEKHYYPMGSQYAYTFYGYYPYSENVNHNGNVYTVDVDGLDGTVDLIWGKSIVSNDDPQKQYAWSAKYFREKKTAMGAEYDYDKVLPNVQFVHKLMKFNIVLKKGSSAADDATVGEMAIKSAKLLNAATRGVLTIASLDNPEDNGKFDVDWTSAYNDTLTLKNADDTDLSLKYLENNDTVKVGGFLIPVLKKQDNGLYPDNGYRENYMQNKGVFRLRVDFVKKSDSPEVIYKSAQYELVPPADGWKEGYEYDVVISVSSPLDIKADASLVPWVKGRIELE